MSKYPTHKNPNRINNQSNNISPLRYISIIENPSDSPETNNTFNRYFQSSSAASPKINQCPPHKLKQLRQMFNKNYYQQLVQKRPSIQKVLNETPQKSKRKIPQKQKKSNHQISSIDHSFESNRQNIFARSTKMKLENEEMSNQGEIKMIEMLQREIIQLKEWKQGLQTQNHQLKQYIAKLQSQSNSHKPPEIQAFTLYLSQQIQAIESKFKAQLVDLNDELNQMNKKQRVIQEKMSKLLYERQLKISDAFKKTNMPKSGQKQIVGDLNCPPDLSEYSSESIRIQNLMKEARQQYKKLSSIIKLIEEELSEISFDLTNCNSNNFKQLCFHFLETILRSQQNKEIKARVQHLQAIVTDVLSSRKKYREIEKDYSDYCQKTRHSYDQHEQLIAKVEELRQSQSTDLMSALTSEGDLHKLCEQYIEEIDAIKWIEHVSKQHKDSLLKLSNLSQSVQNLVFIQF